MSERVGSAMVEPLSPGIVVALFVNWVWITSHNELFILFPSIAHTSIAHTSIAQSSGASHRTASRSYPIVFFLKVSYEFEEE